MTETATETYDPSAHTVAEVTAYLGTASADEVARVKAAEAAGQARVTIANWEAPAPAPTGDDGYSREVIDSPPVQDSHTPPSLNQAALDYLGTNQPAGEVLDRADEAVDATDAVDDDEAAQVSPA